MKNTPDINNASNKIYELIGFIKANHDILEEIFIEEYEMPLSYKSSDFWEDVLNTTIVYRER